MAPHHLGPIVQNAFVVRDLDNAIAFWIGLGVGPFFRVERASYAESRYRGMETAVDYSVAIAQWGDIQIELIRQNCGTPSVYREFLDEGHEGFHHMLTIVPDLAAFRDSLPHGRFELLGETYLYPHGGVLYLRAPEQRWPLLEVGQFSPVTLAFFDMIREAARDWHGGDPVRICGGSSAEHRNETPL